MAEVHDAIPGIEAVPNQLGIRLDPKTIVFVLAHREGQADVGNALHALYQLWNERFPAEHARIGALLVERVDIGTEGLHVRLRVDGLAGLAHEMLAGETRAAA